MCVYIPIYMQVVIYIQVYMQTNNRGGYVGGTVEYGKGGDLGEKAEKKQHSSFL